MRRLVCAASAALLLACGTAAGAQVQQAMHNQQSRIVQGERSGALTWRETRRLEQREARLHREIRQMRARHGGRLTRAERRWVQRQEQANSRAIRKLKHNARRY